MKQEMKDDLHIEYWPIEKLVPYARNPRTHSDAQVAQIAASIVEFGFTNPILVDSNAGIIAGHGRLLAARKLGLVQVPVVVLDHLTETQKRAYIITDNQLALNAGWDEDLLGVELAALRDADFNLDVIGFDEAELDRLLADETAEGLTEEDAVPEPLEEPVTRRGDLWILGEHRLLCGDSANRDDVDRLVESEPIDLVNTDPPYNVRVEPRSNNAIAAGVSSFAGLQNHQKLDVKRDPSKAKGTTRKMRPKDRALANDFMKDADYDVLLRRWFGNLAAVLKPGGSFYIWGGYANCANYPPALAECGLYFSQAIIWVKEHPVLTRKDFMGNHEWCQPAETSVLTPDGRVPIASLRDGDRVISFRRPDSMTTGRRGAVPVHRAERSYAGTLFRVVAGGRETWCTPGHIWSVKLAARAADAWCVYLMRRGRWWRVGKSKFLSTWGFGVKHRLKTEDGDAAWVLSVHESSLEAALHEQAAQARYGIPTTTWNETYASRRTIADVAQLYALLDLDKLERGAMQALGDHGRELAHPFLERTACRPKVGRRVPLTVRACNLLPGFMLAPVPDKEAAAVAPWMPVAQVGREAWQGQVYSLDVPKLEHYIADGIVTHNCFYGWREGAAHWFNPEIKNATDVWSVKKVNPTAMVHLTEKPVELAARALTYSSSAGAKVLDLFGGSGSTLIAAEKLGRRARLMEIDPPYSDVIVRRWQEYTGGKAMLDGDGRSFDEIRDERVHAAA
jgi:DNA modification methylase